MNTILRKLVAFSLVGFGVFCFLKGLPSSVTRDAANGVMPRAVASLHSERPVSPVAAAVKTRAIQDIKVGQRVLAKNPEISNLERRTRRAEPDFGRWLQLSLEMPKSDGSTLHIEMLRSEEWLRNQIGFVIGDIPDPSGERLGVSPPSAIPLATPTASVTPDFNLPSPKTENLQPKTELAPLSPLRPIFSEIAFASIAAEVEGVELVGLTVDLDLPEMGACGTAVITGISTTPEIEQGDGQVVTATFRHPPSNTVLDVVFVDEGTSLDQHGLATAETTAPVRRGSPDPAGTADQTSPEAQTSARITGDLRSNSSAGSGDPRTTLTSSAVNPPGKPPRRPFLAMAGAGGILLALLGIIVITIRDKDGKETVIRVPEGTEIDVKADPGSKVTILHGEAGKAAEPRMAATSKPTDSAATKSETKTSTTSTPAKPLVEMDLTPAPPLGTWEMGPEPPWFGQDFQWFSYILRDANVLPGILDRPAVIPGIKRWNVDTVWPRGVPVKVAYSPDGQWIGVLDAHLHVYDAKTLSLRQILPGFRPQYAAHDFAWSPDSQRIAIVADVGAKVRVFDVEGRLLQEIAVRGGALAVAWCKAGDRLAVGIQNTLVNGSCIEIYDQAGVLVQSLPEGAATEGQRVERQGLGWSEDGKHLVACHLDGKVRVWNLEKKQGDVIDDFGSINLLAGSSWHSSGWLAISNRKEIRIYSPELKLDQTIPISVGNVRWHPDGRRLLCVGYWLTVWDRIEKKEVLSGEGRLLAGGAGPADLSPDGQEVAFSVADYGVLVVAPISFKQPRFESPSGPRQPVHQLAWSPDGKTLAQGTSYHSLHFWSNDGEVIRTLPKTVGTYLD